MFDLALPLLLLCLLPSLFYISRLLFTQFSSGPPCLWCWEVICLYVRAVLSPASPIWLFQTLSAPHHHPDMWASEIWRVFCVCVFLFSFIRSIYICVCLNWPCLTTPIVCYVVKTIACLASVKGTTLSEPMRKVLHSRKPEGCYLSQNKNLWPTICNNN